MKTSVLIPCYQNHFIYLDRVIESYLVREEFGEPGICPDEIVVVLSGAGYIPECYIKSFKDYFCTDVFELDVNLILVPHTVYTGEACSIGEQHCTGDIILIQAADDLSHARRVEIVKKYFEKYDIVALNHGFFGLGDIEYYTIDELRKREIKDIKVFQPWEIKKHIQEKPLDVYGQFCGCKVAAGTLCYKKEIVGKFNWSNKKHGQDTITCKRIALKFNKSLIIDALLYYYFK